MEIISKFIKCLNNYFGIIISKAQTDNKLIILKKCKNGNIFS